MQGCFLCVIMQSQFFGKKREKESANNEKGGGLMYTKDCKEGCQLFIKNFTGKVSVYLFGSMARKGTGKDVDILFEVEDAIFEEYQRSCHNSGVDFLNGKPYDQMDYFWSYHSPAEVRLESVMKILGIDDPLFQEIVAAFKGHQLDIVLFPFGWREDEKFLEIINVKDPKFSKSVIRDAMLLFES